MKKIYLNVLTFILFAFLLLPFVVFADENTYDVWVGGIQVTDSNKNDVLGTLDGEGSTVTFTPQKGEESAKLTLNGATIYEGLMVNEIYGVYWSAIHSNIDLVIDVNGNNILGRNVGESATTQAERENLGYSVNYGIYAPSKNLHFIGSGTLTIVDRTDGIKAKDITFEDNFGELIVSDLSLSPLPPLCAISSDGVVTINGGKFDLVSYNGNGITANKVIIKDGEVKIKANRSEIYTTDGIDINDNFDITNAEFVKDTTNEINYDNDDYVIIKFIKNDNPKVENPETSSFNSLYLIIGIISLIGLSTTFLYLKRKRS